VVYSSEPLSNSLQFINEAKTCRLSFIFCFVSLWALAFSFPFLFFFLFYVLCTAFLMILLRKCCGLCFPLLLYRLCRFLFDVISRETFLLVSANEATYALTWKICGLFFLLFGKRFWVFLRLSPRICIKIFQLEVWRNFKAEKRSSIYNQLGKRKNFANWLEKCKMTEENNELSAGQIKRNKFKALLNIPKYTLSWVLNSRFI